MSLTLSGIPGFTETPDASLASGATLTDAIMKAINDAAKFAIVRTETFWGFYKIGETVQLPTSPADGYEYGRSECIYSWSIYATESSPTALNGTQVPPTVGSTSGDGTALQMNFYVDPTTGAVSGGVAYYKTAQTNTQDGILFVITIATRQR